MLRSPLLDIHLKAIRKILEDNIPVSIPLPAGSNLPAKTPAEETAIKEERIKQLLELQARMVIKVKDAPDNPIEHLLASYYFVTALMKVKAASPSPGELLEKIPELLIASTMLAMKMSFDNAVWNFDVYEALGEFFAINQTSFDRGLFAKIQDNKSSANKYEARLLGLLEWKTKPSIEELSKALSVCLYLNPEEAKLLHASLNTFLWGGHRFNAGVQAAGVLQAGTAMSASSPSPSTHSVTDHSSLFAGTATAAAAASSSEVLEKESEKKSKETLLAKKSKEMSDIGSTKELEEKSKREEAKREGQGRPNYEDISSKLKHPK